MSAEPNTMSLNSALEAATQGPNEVVNFVKTLAHSKIYVVADKMLNSSNLMQNNAQLMLVSDGSNNSQAMLAVFTDETYVSNYLSNLDQVQHPFKHPIFVEMAWALLGIPVNAGIMVNPNSKRGFRISPDIAARLRKTALMSFSLATVDKREQSAVTQNITTNTSQGIEQKLAEIEDYIIIRDLGKAEAILKTLTETPENKKFVLCAKSIVADAKGDRESAIKLIQQALEANSDKRIAGKFWSTLGRYYEEMKKLDEAENAYIQAYACDDTQVKYILDLSHLISGQFRFDEAILLLRRAMLRYPNDPLIGMHLGSLLMDDGRENEALEAFNAAAKIAPDSGAVHFNRAICLQVLGRLNESRIAFELALRQDPALDGYNQYVQTRKFSRDNPDESAAFLELLEQRANENMSLSTRIDSTFALAKIYDSLGDLETSFKYLETANQLKRSALNHSSADTQREMDEIKNLFSREFIQSYAGKVNVDISPIFILGMPRSGTTLTEQILAAHSRVNPGNELRHLANLGSDFVRKWSSLKQADSGFPPEIIQDLQEIGFTYKSRTARLQLPDKRFTDKMPGNFMHIGFIYLLFPNASVVHCHRHPADTCLSCYERLFTKGLVFSYDQKELGEYYKLYLDMMQHWRHVLPESFILDLKYEHLVTDNESQIRRVLDFCKLDFEEACLEFHKVNRTVATASSLQVRQPLYTSSLHRWKKYGDKLAPLLNSLGPELVEHDSSN
jgi:tetratricopeptide (TPR) repeat protein